MEKVISTERRPIKMWLNELEDGALKQAHNLANLPFLFKHVAIMPDAHQGYGMPIGGVIATDGVIIPNAVGVDIGCGMRVVKTSLLNPDIEDLKVFVKMVKDRIPTGFNWHEKWDGTPLPNISGMVPVVQSQQEKAKLQLGTLGGGNHFIELQLDKNNHVWAMIHSGSRNLGKKVCDWYNKKAKELNEKWFSSVPREWDLAFLNDDCEEYYLYRNEMRYCVEFANYNRKKMMDDIKKIFIELWGLEDDHFEMELDVAHNYARLENHFGKNVWVHRKGATSARAEEWGIIPGSQGTASYIVKGLGNKESFMSCSHGAGRIMGRKQAKRELDLEEEKLNMGGIIHDMDSEDKLDEAPSAYKNIHDVMDNQSDLVEVIYELKPIAVVKG